MKILKLTRLLAAIICLAGTMVVSVQAAYTNYMDNFNSYAAGTVLTASMPGGPEWNTGEHTLADNGKNGAGDIYIRGAGPVDQLSDLAETYEFQSGHYPGGDQPRLSNGRFLVYESDAFAKANTGCCDYTSDNSTHSLGFGADSGGGFEFDGDGGNVWLYRVGANSTASGLPATFTFPSNLGTNEWVHLWVQIDGIGRTSQGFIKWSGGLEKTTAIALNSTRFPATAGSEIGVGYLRVVDYRTDTRSGTHGLDVDNLFVHQLDVEAIPEPATGVMIGLGLWLLRAGRRRP